MSWGSDWPELKAGRGCSICRDVEQEDNGHGLRYFRGRWLSAFLQRENVVPGYSVAYWHGRHVCEPWELADDELAGYFGEVNVVSRVLARFFDSAKMNYQILGNIVPHLHVHIFPRGQSDRRPRAPLVWPPDLDRGNSETVSEIELRRSVTELRSLLAPESRPRKG
ncbi:MAG: HIT family protein [Candidatus Dormibacteria bacterium]